MLPFVKMTIFLNRKMNLNKKFAQKKKGEKDIFGQFCANFYVKTTYIFVLAFILICNSCVFPYTIVLYKNSESCFREFPF